MSSLFNIMLQSGKFNSENYRFFVVLAADSISQKKKTAGHP